MAVDNESDPKSYLIGIVVFVMLCLGGISMINSMRDFNPDLLTPQELSDYEKLNKTFQKIDSINDTISGFENDITATENKEFGVFGVLGGLINSAWNTLRFLFPMLSFMGAIYSGFTEFLGLPSWVASCINMLVIIIISFFIYKSIFKT